MFEEFAGDVFVTRLLFCQFQSDDQHIQAEHPHPVGAVHLLQCPAGRQGGASIGYADVVTTEEAAFKYIVFLRD